MKILRSEQQKLVCSIRLDRLKDSTIQKLNKEQKNNNEQKIAQITKAKQEEAKLLLNLSKVQNSFKYPPPLPPPPPPPPPPTPEEPTKNDEIYPPKKKPKLNDMENDSKLIIILDEDFEDSQNEEVIAPKEQTLSPTNYSKCISETMNLTDKEAQTEVALTDEDLELLDIVKQKCFTKELLVGLNRSQCEEMFNSKASNNNKEKITEDSEIITRIKAYSDENKTKMLAKKFNEFLVLQEDSKNVLAVTAVKNLIREIIKQTHDRYYKNKDTKKPEEMVEKRDACCSPVGHGVCNQNSIEEQILNRPVHHPPQYYNGMMNTFKLNETGQRQWLPNWNTYQQQFQSPVPQPLQQTPLITGYQQPGPSGNRHLKTTPVRDGPYKPRFPAPFAPYNYPTRMWMQSPQQPMCWWQNDGQHKKT